MPDITSLSDTIVPKSDQLNAEQLLGGPLTITITEVQRGSTDEQPLILHYDGDGGRPYKPCKSMRKVLIFAWGDDGTKWPGRSMTLFCDPDVKFGGVKVGGIRISHLSHIERDLTLSLTATKGKKAQHVISKLATPKADGAEVRLQYLRAEAEKGLAALQAAWADTPAALRKRIGQNGCPAELKEAAAEADAARAASDAGKVAALNDAVMHDEQKE